MPSRTGEWQAGPRLDADSVTGTKQIKHGLTRDVRHLLNCTSEQRTLEACQLSAKCSSQAEPVRVVDGLSRHKPQACESELLERAAGLSTRIMPR
jgi:hypothetical protein